MSIKILSLSDMLATKIRNGNTRKQLMYRHNHDQITKESGTLDDILDGAVYQQLKADRFNNPLDIALGLYIDGFQPFEGSTQTHTIVQVINLNLHPDERYLLHNVFQMCVIPGRRKPFHLDSFLKPIVDELEALYQHGIQVNVGTMRYRAKITLLFATGDIPAVSDISRHRGHHCYFGCRLCEVEGTRDGGMYFPYDNDRVGMIPMRSQASYREPDSGRRFAVGLLAGGLFTNMETFLGPEFWGLDEMHLLGHGQSKLLYGMLDHKYDHVDCAREFGPFNFCDGVTLASIGLAMEKSKQYIPSVFSGNWSNVKNHHGNYRAVDWFDFLLFVVPTLIIPNLRNQASAYAVNCLVQGISIAASWAVRSNELPMMSALFQAWHVFLKHQVDQKSLAMKVFTITQHYLTHIEFIIKKMGPLPAISCRSLERTIGSYTKNIKATRNNAAYISNLVETTTLMNHIRSAIDMKKRKMLPTGLVDLDARVEWRGKIASCMNRSLNLFLNLDACTVQGAKKFGSFGVERDLQGDARQNYMVKLCLNNKM
jgi:hypothetical protein